uniref:Proline-rich transmembrane protein 1 n=1 Tax=Magallana gigas TaxID=29159 RepID=K1PVS9_MAGGI
MSSEKKSGLPPAYNQVTYPNDQSNFTYGNQYNQYPGSSQYPSPGGAPYPGNQYQPQYNADGQVMTSVVTQPGAVPVVVNPVPPTKDWMVPAVLTCLCCFWPTGIFAIMAASRANSAAANGDVVEATVQSSRARTLVIVSLIPTFVPLVVERAPPTTDWMIPADLSCLCCFCPTGLLAIMASSRVAQPGSVPMVVNTTRPRTDYMVPAVLSCLCCFCPTGIFAILAASRANSAAAEGDFVEAEAQSSRARTLVIISVVVGIIAIVLGIISRVLDVAYTVD